MKKSNKSYPKRKAYKTENDFLEALMKHHNANLDIHLSNAEKLLQEVKKSNRTNQITLPETRYAWGKRLREFIACHSN